MSWTVFVVALVALVLVTLAALRAFSRDGAWVLIPLLIAFLGLTIVVTAGWAILVHGFEPRDAFIGAAVIEGVVLLVLVISGLVSHFF